MNDVRSRKIRTVAASCLYFFPLFLLNGVVPYGRAPLATRSRHPSRSCPIGMSGTRPRPSTGRFTRRDTGEYFHSRGLSRLSWSFSSSRGLSLGGEYPRSKCLSRGVGGRSSTALILTARRRPRGRFRGV